MSKNRKKEDLIRALLGSDDDFDSPAEARAFLTSSGLDPEKISAQFIEYLEDRNAKTEDREKSERLASAVRRLKTKTADTREATSYIRPRSTPSSFWTNRSVKLLASDRGPVEEILERSRQVIYAFSEEGGSVRPVDPFALAGFLKIALVPLEDVPDARTKMVGDRFVVEFNPNRPRGRVRYSICHEIVHTFFPDCGEKIRNRATHEAFVSDDWQLEMLCNIGAGELLMPFEALPGEIKERVPTIEEVLEIRKDFDVSMEAVFLRLVRASQQPFCVFSASLRESLSGYRIDYTRPSHAWNFNLQNGSPIPKTSVVRNCTAIGFSDHGVETWSGALGEMRIECVGIPPYPGSQAPRVMGIISPPEPHFVPVSTIKYVRGDATEPRAFRSGLKIITHIVNDRTANWGGPFASALKRRWPESQRSFQDWAGSAPGNLRLGNTHVAQISEDLAVATIVCQHGYGESAKPRIRYGYLREGLEKLANFAAERNANIHMPRIGSGEARGNWDVISDLIEDSVCSSGIDVTVYTLPNAEVKRDPQGSLSF